MIMNIKQRKIQIEPKTKLNLKETVPSKNIEITLVKCSNAINI